MINYNNQPDKIIRLNHEISMFDSAVDNIDNDTVDSFAEEWSAFNEFDDLELDKIGDEYFDIVPNSILKDAKVLDVGCGSGRWTKYIAGRVKFTDAVDPSDAIFIADKMLEDVKNVRLTKASVDTLPFKDEAFDLVFSLGVLHHIPDTKKALLDCVKKVKSGGYFLVYLYYNLDNRGIFFKILFNLSNSIRFVVSKLPSKLKKLVCDILAVLFYMPFVSLSRLLNLLGLKKLVSKIPLNYYHDKSFYIIRNDSLDRFGTPLEQRFSKNQIKNMLEDAGLSEITFSTKQPFWHAIGKKN